MIDNISRYAAFAAVARHGSISAAAKTMYISQPALSADVAKLERELGTKLFFRTGRGIKLTEAGELLYEYISSALSFIDAGEEKLRNLSNLKSGTLKIGASDLTLRYFLLDYISEFRLAYPDVKLKITNAPTPRTLAALRGGEIDFGVITLYDESDRSIAGITLKRVRTINDIFICSPDCPLAGARGVTTEELNSYPLIMLEGDTSTGRFVYGTVEGLGKPDIELATSDLLTKFCEKGIGVSSVVEDFALDSIERGTLCRIDLEKPLPERYMYLAYLTSIPLSPAASKMIEIIDRQKSSRN